MTLIDLSHTIGHGDITDPRLPALVVRDLWTRQQSAGRYAAGVSFQIASVEMPQNSGTYIDAPYHRHEGEPGVWDLPLERVADLPGVRIDVRGAVREGGRAIHIHDFEGVDVRGRAVLFWTGYDEKWGSPDYSANHHPHLTFEASEALVARRAALVGLDAINADDFSDLARPAHTVLLGAGIPIVENLTNLGGLPESGFRFTAAPVKVKGCGSFPVRAYASVG